MLEIIIRLIEGVQNGRLDRKWVFTKIWYSSLAFTIWLIFVYTIFTPPPPLFWPVFIPLSILFLIIVWYKCEIFMRVRHTNIKWSSPIEPINVIETNKDLTTNNEISLLQYNNIPSKLLTRFDEIKEIWYRSNFTTPYWSAKTLYIKTITKHKNSTSTSNNALFIEHQFSDTTKSTDAFVSIWPDKRDSIANKIISFLAWPLVMLWILWAIDDNIWLQKFTTYFSSIWINSNILLLFAILFSSYLWSLVVKKIRSRNAVKLENRAFERIHDVDSNDPIIARQVCNPVFIADINTWLNANNISECTSVYFDFNQNRILYKLDYKITPPLEKFGDEYVKKYVALTTQMIEKIDILRYMNLVYAWKSLPINNLSN